MSSSRPQNIAELLLNGTKEELTQKLLALYSQCKIDNPNESLITRIQALNLDNGSRPPADLLAQMHFMDAFTKFKILVKAELAKEDFQSDERYIELTRGAGRRMLEFGTIKDDFKPITTSCPFSSFSSEEKSEIVSYGGFFVPKDHRIGATLSAITVCINELWATNQDGFERNAEQLLNQAIDPLKTATSNNSTNDKPGFALGK